MIGKVLVLCESRGDPRVYKKPRCQSVSFSDDTSTEKTLSKWSDEESEKIVKDIRNDQTAKLALLSERVDDMSLSRKLFNFKFFVVSPLYYRRQRHLIGWGTRRHHLYLSDRKLTQYLGREGKSLYDKCHPFQETSHGVLHQ